jgi:Putative prokaryotic signal transducing protein
MTVTRQSLLERFQLLNNDALLALFQSGDLTDLAKEVAEEDLRRRGVDLTKPAATLPVQGDDRSSSGDESTSVSGDLVLIARYSTVLDAQLLQSRLEVEGVPAFVVDDNIVQMNAFLTMAVGGVRVFVPESFAARAREIARGVERGDYALDENNKLSE